MPLRLKQLELQGYKTFATRTTFTFGEGITAVVGPNGSGKSNIADSLRWVLGEQSYTLLRGKKTEDMIFVGSEQRPRAGMAAASLTFDNADGWLPVDFSEVSLARRAYRDGTNEYLLNGQRVRLRDIAELLSRCGLSERTYTIIGQGLVDAALSLKAEERRALFEEAAGIGLYRSKREDALRKLDQTERNLERAQDLLTEIRPRLRALERQAQRAREYDQVKADLDELLKVWYGYHWQKIQRQLAETRAEAEAEAQELAARREQQESLDAQVQDLRAKSSALRAQLNDLHRELARRHTQREAASRELAVADERLRSLARQRQETRTELLPLETDLAALTARAAAARDDLARLQSDLDEARAQATAAQALLVEREAQRRALIQQQQALRERLTALAAQVVERRALADQLSARQAQIETSRAGQAQAATAAAQALEAARAALAAQMQALAEARTHREQIEATQTSQQAALVDIEAQIDDVNSRQNQLRAEEERLTARLEALEEAGAQMAALAVGARAVLAAAQAGRLRPSRGALTDRLQAPAELETAIAAALGSMVNSVVFDEWADVEAALDLLSADGGRAALLPIERLRPLEPWPIEPAPDVVGVAATLVACAPELRPAVDALLGRTLVARTREAALRLAPTLPPDARVVTLSGEVHFPSGVVIGGRGTAPARERRDLPQEIEHARNNRLWLDSARGDLEREAKARRESLSRLQAQLRQAAKAERAATERRDSAALAARRAEQEAAWADEQNTRLDDEAKSLSRDRVQALAEIERLMAGRLAAETELAALTSQLEATSTEELAESLTGRQTSVAVATRAHADAAARLHEVEQSVNHASGLVAARQGRLEGYASETDALEQSIAGRRAAEAETSQRLAALSAEIESTEGQLAELEAKLARVESGEGRSRSNLHLAERKHAEAQLAQARVKEEVEALRRRIEEDFGLVELGYAEEVTGPTPLPLHPLVERLPQVESLPDGLEESIRRRRGQLRRMGAINPEAPAEHQEVRERHDFLTAQIGDLEAARTQLREVIAEMDALMEQEFRKTFEAVAAEFGETFTRLFGGGTARLTLTDPDDVAVTGVDIVARLPGRRQQGLALLSGGERSLAACALIFALLRVSPTPFCVLDEVDAMLDEANVSRFREMLVELSARTQFVIITHNRNTVQAADTVYGVSMGPDSASQVISLKLDGEKVAAA